MLEYRCRSGLVDYRKKCLFCQTFRHLHMITPKSATYERAGCTHFHHKQCERAECIPVGRLKCGRAGCMYLFLKCRNAGLSGIWSVRGTGMNKNASAGISPGIRGPIPVQKCFGTGLRYPNTGCRYAHAGSIGLDADAQLW
jgi:hypothetical protein